MDLASSIKSSLADVLIRSRTTILDLLERRGYNVEPYKKFTGPDLLKVIEGHNDILKGQIALRIDVVHREDSTRHAIVDYRLDAIKQQVSQGTLVKKLLDTAASADDPQFLTISAPETTEVIILYVPRSMTEENESYDKAALEAWVQHKLKIQFFPIHRLVSNPLNHMLQPKFEIVPDDQVAEILKKNYATSKTQFPYIRFHTDMAARCLGLVPGQVVKITRPSLSAGSYELYRTCVP